IKYSPDSKEVQVNVSLKKDHSVHVSVKDSGIGIPIESQPKIFEKFYRVEESASRFQGLGIGLFICAEIIKRHDGGYGVSSEYGKGSEFYFTLPIINQN
ncbi:MAG: yycG 4, partial [Daejeonella sp.]|nr:yycG 4 [Daejeonella sp.]